MIVVSDTSPIIGLASIETLDVLRALYDRVLIPEAVYHELTTGDDLPGSTEVQRSEWIEVRVVEEQAVGQLTTDVAGPGRS